MPTLLYIDTTAQIATIAIACNNNVISLHHHNAKEQAAVINTLIDEVCTKANISLSNLDALVVCAGPGSYTGLRVSLSTAKGIAFALDKPLICLNKLDIIAAHYPYPQKAVALKARTGEYYFAQYTNNETAFAPNHIFAQELSDFIKNDTILVTDDAETLAPNYKTAPWSEVDFAEQTDWLTLAHQRFAAQVFDDTAYAEPFYLKAAYTTQAKPK